VELGEGEDFGGGGLRSVFLGGLVGHFEFLVMGGSFDEVRIVGVVVGLGKWFELKSKFELKLGLGWKWVE
jgi:hypothetical protein